jgi:hypothetical protein
MLRSLFNALMDFAAEKWASEYTTGSPRVTFHCSGLSDAEAARAGGEPRDNSLSNGPHGDWPFVPADLKVSRFHGERNRT